MSMILNKYLKAPTFEDPEKAQTASMLNIILQMGIAISLVITTSTWFFRSASDVPFSEYVASIATTVLFLVAYGLFRRGNLVIPVWIVLLTIHIVVSQELLQREGIRSYLIGVYVIVIVTSGLVVGQRTQLAFIALSMVTIFIIYYAETQGVIERSIRDEVQVFDLLVAVSLTGFATFVFYLLFGRYVRNLELAQENGRALAESNRQLQAIRASLEDHVAARTQRMETLTTLNEHLSTILNRDQLLHTLIEAATTRLSYDHVLVFFYDEAQENLTMVKSSTLPDSAHLSNDQISREVRSNLAERAALEGRVIVGGLESSDIDWQPPASIPFAKSEIAVPILLDGVVVGVLDILDNLSDRLDESDINVLRSLANQISGSLRNTKLFADLEIALAEANAAQLRYQAQSWASIRSVSHDLEHLAVAPTAPLPSMEATQSMDEARKLVFEYTEPTVVSSKPSEKNILVAPIKLQQNIIGALQMHSQGENQQWSREDLTIIETILDQFSQAAENLRLSDSTLKQANREQAIRQITEKMRMATSLESLVEVAASELGEKLGAGHAIVELGVEKTQDTVFNGDNGAI